MMELALIGGAFVALIAAVASMGMLSWWHVRNVQRLPMVAEAQTFEDKLSSVRQQCADLELKKETLEKSVTERAMVAGEVSALKDQLETLRLDLLGKDDARREIDGIKSEIAKSIEEKGVAEQALGDVRYQTETATRDVAEALRVKDEAQMNAAKADARAQDLEATLAEKRAELIRLETELDQARAARIQREAEERRLQELSDRYADIAARVAKGEDRLADLANRTTTAEVETRRLESSVADARDTLNGVQAEHTVAMAERRANALALEEMAAARTRADAVAAAREEELERLDEEVGAAITRRNLANADLHKVNGLLAEANNGLTGIQAEHAAALADQRRDREALEDLTAAAARSHATMAARETDIARLDDEIGEAIDSREKAQAALKLANTGLTDAEHTRDAALARKSELEAETQTLLARKAKLDTLDPSADPAANDPARDLLTAPACLVAHHLDAARPPVLETEALHQVGTYLTDRGLTFPPRTIRAFHTALKIGETSPMTVLAGISGTGKSQLPRRYAEAMGIHFLQIAVQPRWDSPQDLLGFYNFVEERYRATELAQAMVHLDPDNWPEQAAPYKDRMMLVLLDEMNLARVEYYFSEFLSRLESRPAASEAISAKNWSAAQIEFDIKRKDGAPVRPVYPGHNLLFVGTMNEDESTQSLSDKVLDRSNQMHFSRPRDFTPPRQMAVTEPRPGHLTQETWRGWIRPASELDPAAAERCTNMIQSLSDISNACGRAFGHRMNQAIRAYVANYPHEGDDVAATNDALADQIEMRILPKLARVEIDAHESQLKKLADLVRDDLGDGVLAAAITSAIDRSRASSMFAWHGRGASD
jgi:hypothetical protein